MSTVDPGKVHSKVDTAKLDVDKLDIDKLDAVYRPACVAPNKRLCGVTHVGAVRENNQDALFVSGNVPFFIVADGLGGQPAGEVASGLAVRTAAGVLAEVHARYRRVGPRRARAALLRAVHAAHARVLEVAAECPQWRGMATTLIAAWVTHRRVYTVHVGDVRGTVWRRGRLRGATADHSVVGELVRSGALDPEAARLHPDRHIVTQALGIDDGFAPEASDFPLTAGDQVLLCSDGLWEAVTDEELARWTALEGSTDVRAGGLVDLANAAGGLDNITIVLYDHAAETTER